MKNINLKEILKPKNKLVDPTKPITNNFPFNRDWKILISIFAVGLILLSALAWQVFLSDHIGGGYLTADQSDLNQTNVRTISLDRLNKDLLLLENRRAEFQKLKNTQPNLIDPSL